MINVDFVGRLGRDSEVKVSKTGNEYLSFSVASNSWNSRTKEPETEWMDITYPVPGAKMLAQKFRKGFLVHVHGVENVNLTTSNDGKVYVHRNVMARSVDFVFAGTRDSNGGAQASQMGTFQPQGMPLQQQPMPQPVAQQYTQQPMQQPAPGSFQQPVGQPMMSPQFQNGYQQVQTPSNTSANAGYDASSIPFPKSYNQYGVENPSDLPF